jgi:hypothetical protein
MAGQVELCNIALSHLRSQGINDINETSAQAQQCKLHFGPSLDLMLRSNSFSFSRKLVGLAVLTDVDVFNWVHAYQYPPDCLFIEKLIRNNELYSATSGVASPQDIASVHDRIDHEVMMDGTTKVILANEPQLRMRYRSRVTNYDLFDPSFVQAFTRLLAANVAVAIIGVKEGRAIKSDLLSEYEVYIGSTVSDDLNEQYRAPSMSDFELARL